MLIPTPDPDHGDLRTRRPLCLSAQRENESASWEPVRGSRGDGAVTANRSRTSRAHAGTPRRSRAPRAGRPGVRLGSALPPPARMPCARGSMSACCDCARRGNPRRRPQHIFTDVVPPTSQPPDFPTARPPTPGAPAVRLTPAGPSPHPLASAAQQCERGKTPGRRLGQRAAARRATVGAAGGVPHLNLPQTNGGRHVCCVGRDGR